MPDTRRLNRKVRFGFGSAILVLIIAGGFSYRSLKVSNESNRWVSHTYEVLGELQDLLFAVESTESKGRGFALTGKESYVESFHSEALNATKHYARIAFLTADNASQQRRLPALKILSDQKIQYGETLIDLRRAGGLESAAAAVRDGPGDRFMKEYRAAINEMRDEELRLLVQRSSDANWRLSKSRVVFILGNLLGLLIAAAAGRSVQRDSLRRGAVEAALRQTEAKLFEEKELAQVTLQSIGDAVASTDIAGNITFLNVVAEQMTGWTTHEALGRPMPEVVRMLAGGSRKLILNPMAAAVEQNATLHLPENSILVRRDGFETPIDDSVAPIHNFEGKVRGAVIVFRDVSAERATALRLTHLAQHDFLTGLPNRMLFNDRVNHAILMAPRHKKKAAVLFLDLDGFKHINDSLGHRVGDRLLQSVAQRLLDCVRSSDTVSRQGGDEFVVLLSELEDPQYAAQTAGRMLEAVADAHSIDQHDLHVTTSIGVSIYPDDGEDAETLVKNADTAMYQAKEHGRQSSQFFTPAMNVRAVQRQSIETDLRRALQLHEFSLHYQPKINLKTGKITGAEALIRWTHPVRGPVPPAQFIPIAEDCRLIMPIGAWVLREACKQAQLWAAAGLPSITMAVNVSAMQFRNEGFLEDVFAALKDANLDPGCLELELTESVLMKHAESSESILKTLRSQGVRLAIDDFGTGYSSLSYLKRFPIDALKIDQSFVRQIATPPIETTIVAAVIGIGRSLKLRVVAEGVEKQEELAFLQSHQCDEAQGHFFSKPVPVELFAKLLESGSGILEPSHAQ